MMTMMMLGFSFCRWTQLVTFVFHNPHRLLEPYH